MSYKSNKKNRNNKQRNNFTNINLMLNQIEIDWLCHTLCNNWMCNIYDNDRFIAWSPKEDNVSKGSCHWVDDLPSALMFISYWRNKGKRAILFEDTRFNSNGCPCCEGNDIAYMIWTNHTLENHVLEQEKTDKFYYARRIRSEKP